MTWMVRVSTRPWPRSVVAWATGRSCQGRVSRASNRRGLVVFGRPGEVRAAPVQVVRRGALAMQGIGCYHSPVQAHAVEEGNDRRDLIRLGADLGLGCDNSPDAGQGSQQVDLAAVSIPGAADGLAVHPDRDQRHLVIPALTGAGQAPGGTGPLHQPRAGYRV